jgi:hypothetical protein
MSSDIYILEKSDGGIELEIGARSVGYSCKRSRRECYCLL